MKRRDVLTLGALTPALAALGAVPSEAQSTGGLQPPSEDVHGLSKRVHGEVQVQSRFRTCADGHVIGRHRFLLTADLAPWDCDEPCSKVALNGRFRAVIDVVRRENPTPNEIAGKRGCFEGKWTLERLSPTAAPVRIADGTMSGTVSAGTHDVDFFRKLGDEIQEECEECHAPCHFEGVLVGKAYARKTAGTEGTVIPECRGRICASIQGLGLVPPNDQECAVLLEQLGIALSSFRMRVEGAVFSPCPPPTNPR